MRSRDPELARKISSYIEHYYRDHHCTPPQREVAAALGVSQPTVLRYLRAMDQDRILTYDGKVTGSEQISRCKTEYFSAPIVGSINCGDPETEVEQVEEYVSLPASIFGRGPSYLLHAAGTSMTDAGIQPGDLLLIRRQETARPGDIVVALDNRGQNTLKRYAGIDPETHKAVLLYENKSQYPGKRILVKDLVIQGVVKSVIHNM